MKIKILIVLAIMSAVLTSCITRREMPDSVMKEILKESAFMGSYVKNVLTKEKVDTLNFFEPIFEKYGYSVDDFRKKLESLASRKSNALETLIDEAVAEIEVERKQAEFRNDLNNEWVRLAIDTTRRVVYSSNDKIELNSIDSLSKAHISLPLDYPGKYELKYKYYIDSTDTNNIRYLTYALVDSLSEKSVYSRTQRLRYISDSSLLMTNSVTVTSVDNISNQMRYKLVSYSDKDISSRRVKMEFDSIEVTHYYDKSDAVELLNRKVLGLEPLFKMIDSLENHVKYVAPQKKWFDSMFDTISMDTICLRLDSLRLDSLRLDSLRIDSLRLDSLKSEGISIDSIALDSI